MAIFKGLRVVVLLSLTLLMLPCYSRVIRTRRSTRNKNVTDSVNFNESAVMVYFTNPYPSSHWDFEDISASNRVREGELISLVKVVSGRFKRIVFDEQINNISNIADISNAVAKVNKYHRPNGTNPTDPLVRLWVHVPLVPDKLVNGTNGTDASIPGNNVLRHWKAVRESLDKANNIFSGSVEGLILHMDQFLGNLGNATSNHSSDQMTSTVIAHANNVFSGFSYKLAVLFPKSNIFTDARFNQSAFRVLTGIQACCAVTIVYPNASDVDRGVNTTITKYQEIMNKTQRAIVRMMATGTNDTTVVPRTITPYFSTGYPDSTNNSKARYRYGDLVHYWKTMSKWAERTNTTMVFLEAYDVPARNSPASSSLGWWKLKDVQYEGEVFKEKWELDGGNISAEDLVVQEAPVNVSYFEQEEVFDFRKNDLISVILNPGLANVTGGWGEKGGILDKVYTRFSRIVIRGDNHSLDEVVKFSKELAQWNTKKAGSGEGYITASVTFPASDQNSTEALLNQVTILAGSANRNFVGTVSSAHMSFGENYTAKIKLYVGLVVIASMHFSNTSTPLKFGIELPLNSCRKFDTAIQPFLPYVQTVTLRQVSTANHLKLGVNQTIWKMEKVLEGCRKKMEGYFGSERPGVEVFLNVGWPERDSEGKEDVQNFVRFWGEMAKWAKKERVGVVLTEAFEYPQTSNNNLGGFGWWEAVPQNTSGGVAFDLVEKRNRLLDMLPPQSNEVTENLEDPGMEPITQLPPENTTTNSSTPQEEDTTIETMAAEAENVPMSEEEWWLWVYWVVPTVGVILICAVIAVMVTWKLKRNKRQLTKEELAEFFGGSSRLGDNLGEELYINSKYNGDQHEIPLQNINFDSVIGSGKYAMAYKACLSDSVVAVKTPKKECTKKYFKCMLLEVKIMSGIGGAHVNVLRFQGAITKDIGKGMVYIITEYCENGTLLSHLRTLRYNSEAAEAENAKKLDNIHELYKFASEIAAGMHYLSDKDVIHGDLSATNVLLDARNVCKICNFGLTRKLDENGEYLKHNDCDTRWKYLSLETMKHKIITSKSDIWSFGVTLWEIFSLGRIPYKSNMQDGFLEKLEKGLRLKRPKYATQDVYDNMMQCWNKNPTDRPQFKEQSEYFLLLMKEECDQLDKDNK